MIELVDTLPDINVQPAEYKRLLGYPRDHVLSGRARALAEQARAWYSAHGRPWVYARQAKQVSFHNGSIQIDGIPFVSKRLHSMLEQAEADGVVLVAVSAGPEVEAEAQRLWTQEKPDEYFFVEIFGSVVVEHLVTTTGARLCAWADARGMAVLPHYSPGYPEWDIAEQPRLLDLIRRTRVQQLPAQVEVLESGMLRPKKSLLAVFGLTHQTQRVRKLTDLVPCQNCSLSNCQYRRAPYQRALAYAQTEGVARVEAQAAVDEIIEETVEPIDATANYSISVKALRRWADERLTLTFSDDGTVEALFRYEGTTCSNTGRAIRFDYRVKLGPRSEGYPIREQRCQPTRGDDGYTYMCRYMNNAEHLMVAMEREKPLLGQKLNDVIAWKRPLNGAGCYCEPNSRKHKWGLVLETIHYALVQREKSASAPVVFTEPMRRASLVPSPEIPREGLG
ncbi:MAG TPA: hypothetical protein VGR35_05140 [Tepidisphaeraceae bacterium]|nr:hypothetical protein [Tepidisphaeraceae bacterium]